MKLIFLLLINIFSFAKDKKESDVLSFDATVIEGEHKAPSIFLEVDVNKYSDIDSILLIRDDFVSFHKADKDDRIQHFDSIR